VASGFNTLILNSPGAPPGASQIGDGDTFKRTGSTSTLNCAAPKAVLRPKTWLPSGVAVPVRSLKPASVSLALKPPALSSAARGTCSRLPARPPPCMRISRTLPCGTRSGVTAVTLGGTAPWPLRTVVKLPAAS
jgi:hypothetical protein